MRRITIQDLCLAISFLLSGMIQRTIADGADFSRDVQPILSDHCYQCHGPDEAARKADLRLDQKAGLDSVAGDVDDISSSELLRRIESDDPDEVMPPPSSTMRLGDSQRKLLRDWVQAGAKWQGHWAYQTPRRPGIPDVQQPVTCNNPIDSFVAHRLALEGIAPSRVASPERLLRRVTLDLTGLPPTLAEMKSFLADDSPQAYSMLVERLLSSPRYGERMAMDWLDVARYADTNGYQGDRERTMWPWRDWVIDAWNRNQPYDEFTVWQLAGDLMPDSSLEQTLATGFCRNHMINGEGGRIAEENRIEYIFDQIETLGTVWMGLTVQCCRCHDHKFDPIQQNEYYQLFAFFNQTPVDGGGGDPQMAPNIAVPSPDQILRSQQIESQLARLASQLRDVEAKISQDKCQLPEDVASSLGTEFSARKAEAWKAIDDHFAASDSNVVELGRHYRNASSELEKLRKAIPKVMVMHDYTANEKRETFVLNKGLYNQKRDTVTADIPSFLPPMAGAGRDRLRLARWLISPEHPLTARVTVNRIWQTFFGTGLVKTTEDFGVQGEKPSHPELLDWLACEFIESGWDTKYIIRLIVTSATYQQSSATNSELSELDPENRLLARGPRQRLPSWMMRDQALAASGLMVDDIGGRSVKPYQPPGIWEEATFGNKKYVQDHGADLYRRSLYVFWRRIVGPTMFFDAAKRQTCSVKTVNTNTPLHALVTLNDVTYVEAARAMAARIVSNYVADEGRLTMAFQLTTSRKPNDAEVNVLADRLNQLRIHFSDNQDAATELMGVGESTVSTLAPRDEMAAYTSICLLLLNLDEALNK